MNNRRLWAATAAGLVATVVSAGLAPSAHAATAPHAPYTELRVDGAYGSAALGEGRPVDVTDAQVTVTPDANAITFRALDGSAMLVLQGRTADPATDNWASGRSYSVGRMAGGSVDVGLSLALPGSCPLDGGSLDVHEASRDASGVLTSFAGTLTFTCSGAASNVAELRYNSTVDRLAFGAIAPNSTSDQQTVTVTPAASTTFGNATFGDNASGKPLGNDPFYPFRLVSDTCSGTTIAAGGSCTLGITAHPTQRGGQAGAITLPAGGGNPAYVVSLTAAAVNTTGGAYTSLQPSRLLDTRTASGGGAFSAGQVRSLQVTGKGGVPTTGVSAVALNVTVVSPTKAGNLSVFPTGTSAPRASTVNFNSRWTGASLTTVPIGTGGKVDIKNATGAANVIVDVVGYYRADKSTAPGSYGGYFSGAPFRLIDTRQTGQGPALDPSSGIGLSVDFNDSSDPFDYNSHVKALAVNVTAVGPTAAGHFTTWNGSGAVPNTSTLNFTKGATAPNMTIVPTTACAEDWCTPGSPMFAVFNGSSGSTHLIVDCVGYFDDNQTPGAVRFVPRTPTRIVDTRSSLGTTTPGAGQTRTVVAPASVAGLSTYSVVTALTAVAPQQNSAITLWANTGPRPTASNLNPAAGQLVSNMTITGLGGNNDFNMYNGSRGTTNLIVDVLGTMEHYPSLASVSTPVNGPPRLAAPRDRNAAQRLTFPATGPQTHRTAISGPLSIG